MLFLLDGCRGLVQRHVVAEKAQVGYEDAWKCFGCGVDVDGDVHCKKFRGFYATHLASTAPPSPAPFRFSSRTGDGTCTTASVA